MTHTKYIILILMLFFAQSVANAQNLKKYKSKIEYDMSFELTNNINVNNVSNYSAFETIHGISLYYDQVFVGGGIGYYWSCRNIIFQELNNITLDNIDVPDLSHRNFYFSLDARLNLNHLRKIRKYMVPYIEAKVLKYLYNSSEYKYISVTNSYFTDNIPVNTTLIGGEICLGAELVTKYKVRPLISFSYQPGSRCQVDASNKIKGKDESIEEQFGLKYKVPGFFTVKVGFRL